MFELDSGQEIWLAEDKWIKNEDVKIKKELKAWINGKQACHERSNL